MYDHNIHKNKGIQLGKKSRYLVLIVIGFLMCAGFFSESTTGGFVGVAGVISICAGLIIETMMNIQKTLDGKQKRT